MTETFESDFGFPAVRTVFTPGRVNLLGEHVDYSAGMVLPMAISLGITLSIAPNPARDSDAVASAGFSGLMQAGLAAPKRNDWSDYVRGGLQAARAKGWIEGGQCVFTSSTLPHGAGLSSSAAVIVSVLKACAPDGTDLKDIAVLARKVENEFIGVPCGIMDQMAVAISQPGEVLALDTLSFSYDVIPLPPGLTVGVIHSGVSRTLADGRYAVRREEILSAAKALGVDWLCHADISATSDLPEPLSRRARHVISEDARTRAAAEALRNGDFKTFVRFVNDGHVSIRDDFEISTPEVDAVVASAIDLGAIAARQTGGGFGGCIVVLFQGAEPADWFNALKARHPAVSRVVPAA